MKNLSFLMKTVTIFLILLEFTPVYAQEKVEVEIDVSQEIGLLRRSELYNNNSLLRTPGKAITDKYAAEIGISKIMRNWLTIDDYWDYTTDQYNYNFKCGWDLNQWDNFYNYMERFSEISEEILLNVRGFQREVVSGEITMDQWRVACKNGIKHYKQKFPKIKYIEALNEYEVGEFGGLTNDEYYKFYQEFYQIINEINQELKPEIPLLIGGPCISDGSLIDGRKKGDLRDFFENYSMDDNQSKKLDFISYHDYLSANDPSLYQSHPGLIKNWSKEFGISDSLPIFITELGDNSPDRFYNTLIQENQLLQASLMASIFFHFNKHENVQGFQWVIQHKNQDRKNQIYDNLRWSPYGMSLKMQARLAANQIKVDTPELSEGKGIYCIASKDESKVTVLIWNYQWENGENTHTSVINFNNIPINNPGGTAKIKEYLLDLEHNNIHTKYPLLAKDNPNVDQLTLTKESELPSNKNISYSTTLAPNAMALIEITFD